tara:strand:+ start:68 stop:1438 length:1371 start_codon:yes stop_codon:yes gene_type:complete
MKISQPTVTIDEDEGFEKNDLFELKDFGERLENLFVNLDTPLVVALDGEWGTGKSTFAKQWAGSLRSKKIPTIYFDAFANDFQEDAFIALTAEILRCAETTNAAGKSEEVSKVISKAKVAGRVLMPFLAKAIMKAAFLGAISTSDLDGISEEFKSILKDTGNDTGTLVEKLIEDRFRNAIADREALESFKISLCALAEKLSKQSSLTPVPLVIIVDELDRCRPSFALNLLERVKHLFSVDGVSFLFVTNLKQLQASARKHYGHETDAEMYIDKFFNIRISLPKNTDPNQTTRAKYLRHILSSSEILATREIGEAITDIIIWLSEIHNLSLRSIEKIATQICLLSAASGKARLDPFSTGGLIAMRQISPSLFRKAQNDTLNQSEVEDFMQFHRWEAFDNHAAEMNKDFWICLTDRNINGKEIAERYPNHRYLANLNRRRFLPNAAKLIEQLPNSFTQ